MASLRIWSWLPASALALTVGCGGTSGGSGDGGGGGTAEESGTASESGGEGAEGSGSTAGEEGPTGGSGGPTGGESGGEGGNTAPVSDAVERLLDARCDWLFGCCTRGELDVALGPFTADKAECVARVVDVLESGNTTPPVQAGPTDLLLYLTFAASGERVELVGDVDACVESLTGQACTPQPDPDPDPIDHCTPAEVAPENPCDLDVLFSGLQPVGAECTQNVECSPGLRCIPIGEVSVCAAQAEEGEFCFRDADCQNPLFCDFEVGQCSKGAGSGETCAFRDPQDPRPGTETIRCEQGLSCDPDTLKCVGDCAAGSRCFWDQECPENHVCAFERCAAPGDTGEPCEEDEDCASNRCDGAFGTCADIGQVGDDCFNNGDCDDGLYCRSTDDICRRLLQTGDPCSTDEQCQDGFCDSFGTGDCTAYPVAGDTCTSNFDCSNPGVYLLCVDAGGGLECTEPPLPNGADCSFDGDCESELCFNDLCQSPATIGGDCSVDVFGSFRPCNPNTGYCEVDPGESDGTCVAKGRAGSDCENSSECFGACSVTWGRTMCSASVPAGEAWCDGE